MLFRNWPFLLTGVSLCIQSIEAAYTTHNLTIHGSTTLREDVANEFLGCLNATKVPFQLYVDGGWIIVLPPKNFDRSTIDFDDPEDRLDVCMMLSSSNMAIASEHPSGDTEEQVGIVSAADVTHSWLVDQGVKGRRQIGYKLMYVDYDLLEDDTMYMQKQDLSL
ncbi:hypothetical protein N7490_007231 [Penicillium lividum]|nr:hypothetical protein N7490_007231 [Penicillium lividum]